MNNNEKLAIKKAISNNNFYSLGNLLANKPPKCYSQALSMAIRKGNNLEQFVSFFLNRGADVNANFDQKEDLTIFGNVCRHSSANIVNMMLDHGADLYLKNKFGLAPIHEVFNSGDVGKINVVSQRGIDSGKINSLGLLHYCVRSKNCENNVKILLKHGANVNGFDEYGKTVLFCAVGSENSQAVKLLTVNGADVNGVSKTRGSALAFAAEEGYVEIAKILLDNGANIDGNESSCSTPIESAAYHGKEGIVKLLLDRGARRDDSLIMKAIAHPRILQLLLDRGFNANHSSEYGTAVRSAVRRSKKESVKLLLDYGAEVNDGRVVKGRNYHPLHCAIETGDIDTVSLLLDRGADINVESCGKTALKLSVDILGGSYSPTACRGKREEIVKLLLDKGARRDDIILHSAVRNNCINIAKLLLNRGFNTNCTVEGETAFTLAIIEGRKEIVKLILDNGSQVIGQISEDGGYAFHRAVKCGYEEIVQLLLERGADANVEFHGQTALMMIIRSFPRINPQDIISRFENFEKMVKVLLNHGATPDNDILHAAIGKNHPAIVQLLLDHGADANCLFEGQIALSSALRERNYNIVKLLLDYGADLNKECGGTTALSMAVGRELYAHSAVLVKHMIQIKSLGLFVSEVNLNATKRNRKLNDFQNKCVGEAELLMGNEFVDTSYAYLDILKIKDIDKLAGLARNSNIVQVLKSVDFVRKFPLYGPMIVRHFEKGVLKNKDFELFKRFIDYLSTRDHDQLPQLPFTVVDKIFSYLVDKDIATFRKL